MNIVFQQGALQPAEFTEMLLKSGVNNGIGAYSTFLGQVRADIIDGKIVNAIEFTTYDILAYQITRAIVTEVITKYKLLDVEIKHGLGVVQAGQICFLVHTASAHRKAAIESCNELVERIKAEVPLWGKEIFSDNSHTWKQNTGKGLL